MTASPILRLALLLCLLGAAACTRFDAPPQVTIVGLKDGKLADPEAPLTLVFHEPIVPETLSLKLIVYKIDAEGNLADVDPDDETELDILYEYNAQLGFEEQGSGTLDVARRTFTIKPDVPFPVGPQLALLIEPKLRDDAGNDWVVRQIVKFAFELACDGDGAPSSFPTGFYFMNVEVDKPISTQILLWCDIRLDPATGKFVGQFTNADRDPHIDCAVHGLQCKATEVCRTLPSPACVLPSERAGTSDEYPDYYANNVPPEGYSFTVRGCIVDQPDGSYRFANEPADVVVQSPPVTAEGITLSSSWAYDKQGVLRGSGTFQAKEVYLGTSPSGAGVGSHEERQVDDAEVPEIPAPPSGSTP